MSNTAILLLIMLVSLSMPLLCAFGGKSWLYICSIALALTTSVTAGKIVSIDVPGFGLQYLSIATPIYAGLFLIGDLLSILYGKEAAYRAIRMGFAANVCFTVLGVLTTVPDAAFADDKVASAISSLFSFVPRLIAGGLLAYIISSTVNVWLFHRLSLRWDGSRSWHLAGKNNISTIVAQGLDTVLIYAIAFWGVVPHWYALILPAWGFKIIVALCDTPFVYIGNYLKPRIVKPDATA